MVASWRNLETQIKEKTEGLKVVKSHCSNPVTNLEQIHQLVFECGIYQISFGYCMYSLKSHWSSLFPVQ